MKKVKLKAKSKNNVFSIACGIIAGLVVVLLIVLGVKIFGKKPKKMTPKIFTYELDEKGNACITGLSDWGRDSALIVIPESIDGHEVVEIADNAFESNTTIISVTLPESIKKIGNRSFYNCVKITEITLPSNLISIGAECFYGSGIKEITIPKSTLTIGLNALKGFDTVYYYSDYITGSPWGASNAKLITD